ncbi:hypothetical protein [Sphingomonas sp. HITSZ_GF]|uniref:hypothetical protein n=1 Tax=Sphingomonas sp. HITSZ_GF TaxID=3037247 RepID=UPI00240D9D9B|nr:hypothetical protein [Sphingomonas sp. HITSZ_GF]
MDGLLAVDGRANERSRHKEGVLGEARHSRLAIQRIGARHGRARVSRDRTFTHQQPD